MELAGQQRRVELTILYLFSYYRRFTRNSCSLHKEKTGYCVNTFMHAIETALPFRTKNVCGVIEVRWRSFRMIETNANRRLPPPFPCCIALDLMRHLARRFEKPHREKFTLKKVTLGLT